jgi:hypothetical protein
VNTPPAEAGGFGLRLKAGSIGHSTDYQSLSHPEGVVKGGDPFSLREKAVMRGPEINGLLILIPSP